MATPPPGLLPQGEEEETPLPLREGLQPARTTDTRTRELLLCLAAGALSPAASPFRPAGPGRELNWDLRNYHLYNPYALLHGRIGLDLLPAGIQSTFNPALDVPYYWLATGPLSHAPRVLAALAGLPFGLLVYLELRLAAWAMGEPGGIGRALPWLAAIMGGSAAATASEIGTTFNDIPIAALLLGGLLLGLPRPGLPTRRALLFAGALLGAAVALKPTAAAFAPGIGVALLLLWPRRLAPFSAVCAGALAALLLIAGPWALTLHHLYGSPVFPLMNALFRSEWYPPIDLVDTRFRPGTLARALAYPFRWASTNAMLATEPPFRDARIALALCAIPALALAAWRRRLVEPRRVAAILAAFGIGLALWLPTLSILRYALVLEASAAILIVATLRTVVLWAVRIPAAAPAAVALVLAGLLWHTRPPDWWRVPYGRTVFDVEPIRLPPGALIVAINAPVAMVLPFIDAPGHRAIGLTADTLASQRYRLFTELERAIRTHQGPMFALTDETARAVEAAPWFGMVVDGATCHSIRNNITLNGLIMLCPMTAPERGPPAPSPPGRGPG